MNGLIFVLSIFAVATEPKPATTTPATTTLEKMTVKTAKHECQQAGKSGKDLVACIREKRGDISGESEQ